MMSYDLTVKSSLQIINNEILINGFKRNDLVLLSNQEISYYDRVRTPRKINYLSPNLISEDKLQSIIKEVFSCSICLSIMNDPINSKECIHRFCKQCLNSQIRKVKKECPICKKKIDNMRLTRSDQLLSNLINIIIPDIPKFMEFDDKKMKINISSCINTQKERSLALKSDKNYNDITININKNIAKSNNNIVSLIEENENKHENILNTSSENILLHKKIQRENDEDILIPTKRLKNDIKIVTEDRISLSDLKNLINENNELYFLILIYNESNERFQLNLILNNIDFMISDFNKYISKNQIFSSKNFFNINYYLEMRNDLFKLNKEKYLKDIIYEQNITFTSIIKILFNFQKNL